MAGKDPLFRLTCSEKWIPLPIKILFEPSWTYVFIPKCYLFTNTPHNKHYALKHVDETVWRLSHQVY